MDSIPASSSFSSLLVFSSTSYFNKHFNVPFFYSIFFNVSLLFSRILSCPFPFHQLFLFLFPFLFSLFCVISSFIFFNSRFLQSSSQKFVASIVTFNLTVIITISIIPVSIISQTFLRHCVTFWISSMGFRLLACWTKRSLSSSIAPFSCCFYNNDYHQSPMMSWLMLLFSFITCAPHCIVVMMKMITTITVRTLRVKSITLIVVIW